MKKTMMILGAALIAFLSFAWGVVLLTMAAMVFTADQAEASTDQADEYCAQFQTRAQAIMQMTQFYSLEEMLTMIQGSDDIGRVMITDAFNPMYPTGNVREQIMFGHKWRAVCLDAYEETAAEIYGERL